MGVCEEIHTKHESKKCFVINLKGTVVECSNFQIIYGVKAEIVKSYSTIVAVYDSEFGFVDFVLEDPFVCN